MRATVIKPNQSIKLRARKETLDRDGNKRVTGEEWLVKKVGAYLPGAYEEVVDVVDAYVLTEKVACCIVIACDQIDHRWPCTCALRGPSLTRTE